MTKRRKRTAKELKANTLEELSKPARRLTKVALKRYRRPSKER